MFHLDVTETSKALAVSGGYISLVGLVSYFVKEKLFMSEALIALLIGIITGPIALNWFNPFVWAEDQSALTHQVTRIVIAIQVLFTGISLPAAYLRREWLSLTTLLGPVMTTAWFISSLLVWGLVPGLTFLESLVIGACVTPTDPVLSNAICKGRFAEKHVPLHVRNIIVAEAGANDGLGFPFLFIGLYLILIHEPSHPWHSIGGAVAEWFYNIVLYQVVLACVIGSVIGYIARKALRFAKAKQLIDNESFLSFGVALTFVTLGVVGILGSDDILCCFVVGNSFTWDDWFRLETEDDGFQEVIDQLLNSAVFLYIGAIIPWGDFSMYGMTPWRLVILGILIMLVRRLPWVWVLSRWIPSLRTTRESVFAGFFGPIGVGAVFYVQVALDTLPDDGTRTHLRQTLLPTVYFLVFTSVIVHGITIPLGKGFQRAKTITLTRTSTGTGLFANSNSNTRDDNGKASGTEGNRYVSRLPPPLPVPLPLGVGLDGAKDGKSASAIRFDEPPSTGASGTHTPQLQMEDLSETDRGRDRNDDAIESTGTASDIAAGEKGKGEGEQSATADQSGVRGEYDGPTTTWMEGEDIVIESRDGEYVKVIRPDGTITERNRERASLHRHHH
ncbi:hypothetical protein I316_07214 [Kwoniella heveanensis BCC8398]|uniref:Cation/H+ exchanger transmembrane domain-containing protein n=1 Tax=Kwoniella heveanensis BCC8398 TaxID=1296120 RepID=A0A1B9GJE0_9TREE|nr:hypothetical protein I316_07214 [Kwoniella heveanensis BCC8398]